MNMADVSAVIPENNAESYLKECLDSLRNQTPEDLKLICDPIDRSFDKLRERKEKEPLRSLEALYALKGELEKRGVFEKYKKSFTELVLSTLYSNISTNTGSMERYAVLEELQSDKGRELGILELSRDEYPNNCYKTARIISSAIEQHNLEKKWMQPVNPQIRYAFRGDQNPSISVIIPVYNTERYLEEALHSIAYQTFENIEIICVNDGSTDGSLELLEKWAEKDPRFVLLTQENHGLSAARNTGLDVARGSYIYFLDSDDWLKAEALEELYNRATEDNLDVLTFEANTFKDIDDDISGLRKNVRKNQYPGIYSGADIFCDMRLAGEYYCPVWRYFIKRDLLEQNHIDFCRGILYEDNPFTFRTILAAKRVGHTPKQYYQKRFRSNSIMTSKPQFLNSYSYFRCYLEMQKSIVYYAQEMTSEQLDTASALSIHMLNNARRIYGSLEDEEMGGRYGLMEDFFLFVELIQKHCENLADVRAKKNELQKVRNEKKECRIQVKTLEGRVKELENESIVKFLRRKAGRIKSRGKKAAKKCISILMGIIRGETQR